TITPTASASATASATATVPVVSFAEIEQTIFRTSCAVQFCHDSVSGGFSGNLVLEPGRAYAELVNHAPDNPSAATMGFKRVVPGDTANSFLLLKVCDVIHSRDLCPTLLPLINPILGSRMPLVGPPISNEAVAAIHAWILRGAAESE
ncbi:MAG TPA: hypothetical protein VEB21_17000, partial [Terriglobales bacterium]|nr:hypothetical protein [Terriglobales bacterium]